MSSTPYRCSLGKTRPKEAKPKRTKRANEDRIRTNEELSSACLSLPKIPSAAELIRRKHECSKTSVAKHDSSELESDEEHHCDFLSCGSLKIEEQVGDSVQSARETTRESRSRSLPLILNRENTSSCLKCNTRACKFRLQTRESYPPRPSVGSDLCYLRDNSLIDQDFTKVMEDGSRVTVKQRRLFIEIFMPRTSWMHLNENKPCLWKAEDQTIRYNEKQNGRSRWDWNVCKFFVVHTYSISKIISIGTIKEFFQGYINLVRWIIFQ